MVPVTVHLPAGMFQELQASDILLSDLVRETLRNELDRRRLPAAIGLRYVTPAERRVLAYLTTHLTLAEIGERLHLRRTTVKSHVASIYGKMNVSSRSELVRRLDAAPDSGALGLTHHVAV